LRKKKRKKRIILKKEVKKKSFKNKRGEGGKRDGVDCQLYFPFYPTMNILGVVFTTRQIKLINQAFK
jgi:hypothetical protein